MKARWNLGFVVLLALALALCGMQTAAILRFRDPSPSVLARLGEPVEVDGVRLTLDRFEVAPRLPGPPGKEPVVAMPGARVVAAVLTLEVTDPARDLATIYCTFTLVDDGGRRWTTDYDVGGRADLPQRLTCASSETYPVTRNQPYAVAAAFTIPADAAESVRLRMDLGLDDRLVEFAR